MTGSGLAAARDRIDQYIGDTPMVRLGKVAEPGMAEVWVKLEGQNPGGSVKDRPALAMVLDAEERGLLRPGGTIIEPTSGNTGIGLAQIASARGYRLILCLPAQMSDERKRTLRAYGAELILTDPVGRMPAAIAEAQRIGAEHPEYLLPNQFDNPANPRVHLQTTGPEIWRDLRGRVDALVVGSGTGGTITGAGRFLRSQNPRVEIVAVEPARSAVISGEPRGEHQFQGMGPGFIPANLDLGLVDQVIKVWEEDAFPLVRRLAREEGLFLGMSSGGAIVAALEVARRLGPGKKVAVISADGGSRYLTTPLYAEE